MVWRLALTLARVLAAQALRRLGMTLALWALAGVFLLIGLLGLTLAAWIALAEALGPIAAALIVGGGGLVLCAVTLLIARSRRPLAETFAPEAAALHEAVRDHKTDLETWMPLIGLALLGFLLGSGKRD